MFPYLKELPRQKSRLNAFYGYEHLAKVRPGAFYDMQNCSSDRWPLLGVRQPRLTYYRKRSVNGTLQPVNITADSAVTAAAVVNGTAVYCSQNSIYYHGQAVENAPLDPNAPHRGIIPFGRNFFVVPDGKYVITDEGGVTEVRHAAFTQALLGAEVSYAVPGGNTVTADTVSAEAPLGPFDGQRWIDVSGDDAVLKIYTELAWQAVSIVYIKAAHAMAAHYAVPGDAVTLELIGHRMLSGTVQRVGDGWILLRCPGAEVVPGEYMTALRKPMPPLDFALEHENRIWGCRFGIGENGEFVNEIYASALGDPTQWHAYNGISTDSYTAGLGCPGPFTGAAAAGGAVLFFKEDYIIRVCGSAPQDYTVSVLPARGAAPGCGDTCVNLNEKVFYLSGVGVTVYDGALPYGVSPDFDARGFTQALACAHNGKYYLAAERQGERRIYVYDTAYGVWHAEDDAEGVCFFLPMDGAVYMLCRTAPDAADYRLVAMRADETAAPRDLLGPASSQLICGFLPAAPVSWFAETGPLHADNGACILRGAVFRVTLAAGASFKAELQCGDDDRWTLLCAVKQTEPRAFSVPAITPRCDRFRLRLSGTGDCVVHTVSFITEKTGEVPGLVQ